MARGRLISRSLGSSRKFAALGRDVGKLGEFAQVLFPLLVANADDFGRQSGDAFTVKHAVFPTSARKESDFSEALKGMHDAGLVRWYEVDSQQVVQIVDFDEHQPGLSRRTSSKFPEVPVNFTAIHSELNRTEQKGTEQKRTALTRGDDEFTAFWESYPKKKSRSDAEKAWRKLAPSPELVQRIVDVVAVQRESPEWLKDDGQFIPYPATFLNKRRWEDSETELLEPKQAVYWADECKAIHGGTCQKRWDHETKKIDARNQA